MICNMATTSKAQTGLVNFVVMARSARSPHCQGRNPYVRMGLVSLFSLQACLSTKHVWHFVRYRFYYFLHLWTLQMTLCYRIWAVGSVSVDKWRYLNQANMASLMSVVVCWGSHLITVSDKFRAWKLTCNPYQFQQCRRWMQTTWMYM